MRVKLRSALQGGLLLIIVIPLLAFGWIGYDRTLSREYAEVRERHLQIAQNLASALEQYDRSVRGVLDHLAGEWVAEESLGEPDRLMSALNVQNFFVFDSRSGEMLDHVGRKPNPALPDAKVAQLSELASGARFRYSPVMQAQPRGNALYAVAKRGDVLFAAELSTTYFQVLQSDVTFGENGHVAIVDHTGQVLAHPLQSWVNERKDIAKVSAVERMLRGETGIEEFFSPAFNGDMIAGITSVPATGWGVMVPQPVAEIHGQAWANVRPAVLLMLASCLGLFFLGRSAARLVAVPMEKFASILKNQKSMGVPQQVRPDIAHRGVTELREVIDAYNDMAAIAQRSAASLAERAMQDGVTGIGNREYFEQTASKQLNVRTARGQQGILLFVDLDNFKVINDTYGHAVGDGVLKSFSSALYPATKRFLDGKFRGRTATHPVIGRIGGDEFAVLMPVTDEFEDFNALCEEFRQTLPASVNVDGITIPCMMSIGGAVYPRHGTNVGGLMRRADVALYHAKLSGRNRFELYGENCVLGGSTEIRAAVGMAIANDELLLEYQPKFCLNTRQFNSVEALIRWDHPVHGRIPPSVFLPAIQNTHLMAELGEWVVKRAIREIGALNEFGLDLRVAVNVGAEHFNKPDFVKSLVRACKKVGFDHDRLEVEITEEVMDSSKNDLEENARAMRKAGFKLSVDDFGSGYSNLSRLAALEVDIIKLDRTMVWDAEKDKRCLAVMRAAIDMAHSLNCGVVVEGVETVRQVKMAEAAGADSLQGFYFSASLPSTELVDWISSYSVPEVVRQRADLESRLLEAKAG